MNIEEQAKAIREAEGKVTIEQAGSREWRVALEDERIFTYFRKDMAEADHAYHVARLAAELLGHPRRIIDSNGKGSAAERLSAALMKLEPAVA